MNIKSMLRLTKVAVAALLMVSSVHGQVLLVSNQGNGTVGSYNAVTGAVINSTFISGLSGPNGITHDSSSVYVTSISGSVVGKYNATTGAVENAALISGLTSPTGIVYDAGFLYVSSQTIGTVGKYSAADGSVVNASLFTVGGTRQIELFNGNLYVTDYINSVIGVYTTAGVAVNASFVTGINSGDMAFSGGSMYVTNLTSNSIDEYNALTGALITSSLVTGLSSPVGLVINGNGNLAVANVGAQINEYTLAGTAVNTPWITSGIDTPVGLDIIAVPEPTTLALLGAGFGAFVFVRRSRHRRQLAIA